MQKNPVTCKRYVIYYLSMTAFLLLSPKEPAPPPPPEPAWSTVPSKVSHLTSKDFKSFLKSKSSVLVMFYAPWCGHCKKAKPEYQAAADKLAKESDSKVFAAVDCTTNEGKDTAIPHTWHILNIDNEVKDTAISVHDIIIIIKIV